VYSRINILSKIIMGIFMKTPRASRLTKDLPRSFIKKFPYDIGAETSDKTR